MIPVLNECKVRCAVFGNHDFGKSRNHLCLTFFFFTFLSFSLPFFLFLMQREDYGLENLVSVTEKTNFPWLISNVLDIETGRPLAEGKIMEVIEKNGKKVSC